ncbi:hypothetical protein D9613_004672 [Agrocybe pediades]|uniref:Uncharacterized protein n=1 Tax=Agrocybe pediades TaxID=84607 RepID=A0A8H4QXB8_9AGAR|nr:hypothetical protein D9613_004672 [Agrocybe pediades]
MIKTDGLARCIVYGFLEDGCLLVERDLGAEVAQYVCSYSWKEGPALAESDQTSGVPEYKIILLPLGHLVRKDSLEVCSGTGRTELWNLKGRLRRD